MGVWKGRGGVSVVIGRVDLSVYDGGWSLAHSGGVGQGGVQPVAVYTQGTRSGTRASACFPRPVPPSRLLEQAQMPCQLLAEILCRDGFLLRLHCVPEHSTLLAEEF